MRKSPNSKCWWCKTKTMTERCQNTLLLRSIEWNWESPDNSMWVRHCKWPVSHYVCTGIQTHWRQRDAGYRVKLQTGPQAGSGSSSVAYVSYDWQDDWGMIWSRRQSDYSCSSLLLHSAAVATDQGLCYLYWMKLFIEAPELNQTQQFMWNTSFW